MNTYAAGGNRALPRTRWVVWPFAHCGDRLRQQSGFAQAKRGHRCRKDFGAFRRAENCEPGRRRGALGVATPPNVSFAGVGATHNQWPTCVAAGRRPAGSSHRGIHFDRNGVRVPAPLISPYAATPGLCVHSMTSNNPCATTLLPVVGLTETSMGPAWSPAGTFRVIALSDQL
jgi:hypothetical protein